MSVTFGLGPIAALATLVVGVLAYKGVTALARGFKRRGS